MNRKYIVWASILLWALTSCEDFKPLGNSETPIKFGVSVYNDAFQTKTTFSGEQIGPKERIDWRVDDKILIHMYADGEEEQAPYTIVDYWDDGGYVSIAPLAEPINWKPGKKHKFIGIYPADFGEYNGWDNWHFSPITFYLPSVQDGDMAKCFMAAITKGYEAESDETVTLEFSPMVTTLYFILNNDDETTDLQVERLELEESNNWKPLVAKYTVEVSENGFNVLQEYGFNDNASSHITVNVNKTVPAGQAIEIPVFITPLLGHNPSNFEITVYLSNKKLSNSLANRKVAQFDPLKKYDIKVNLSGEGTEVGPGYDPTIPPIVPESDGAAQVLLLLMQRGQLNGLFTQIYKELYGDNVPGYTDYYDFWNHCLYDKFINGGLFKDNPLDNMKKEFPEEVFHVLGILAQTITDLTLDDIAGGGITTSVYADDFKLFPNVTSISLYIAYEATDKCEIYIEGLEYLQTVTIEHPRYVDIRECGELKTVTLKNTESRTDLNVDRSTCPKYTGN